MTDASSFSGAKSFVLVSLLCAIGILGVFSSCSAALSLVIFLTVLLSWLIILTRPIAGIYCILIFLPMLNLGFTYDNPVRINDEFVPIVVIPIILTLFVFFIRKSLFPHQETQKTTLDTPANILFLFFAGYALTSMSWSIDIQHGINKIYMVLFGFALFKLIPELVVSRESIRSIIKIVPFLGLVLAIQFVLSGEYPDFRYDQEVFKNVLFVFTLHTFGDAESLRPGGFAPPDIAAGIFTLFVFFNIILIYDSRWKVRILLLMHTLLMLFCLLKTASKAGVGSLFVGLVSLAVIVPELRNKIIRLTAAAIAVLSGLLLVAGHVFIKRIQIMLSGEVDFLQDRIDWWKEGFNSLYSTWGFGLGAGGFAKVIDPIPAAHSFYFSILFEYGIIGFVLFACLIGLVIYRIAAFLSRMFHDDLKFASGCLLGALVSIFVHGFVELEYTYLMLWFLLGFMVAIQKVSLQEGERLLRASEDGYVK